MMPLTVRTTVTGAGNSLAALAFADAYFDERVITAWAGTPVVKEGALIRATDYIDGRFGERWSDDTLALETLPTRIQKACCEYALRALAGPLAPDPRIDASGFSVVNTKRKVGPLEQAFAAVEGQRSPMLIRAYPAADMLLASFLTPLSGRVVR